MFEEIHHFSSIKPPRIVISLLLISRDLRNLILPIFGIFLIAFIEKLILEYCYSILSMMPTKMSDLSKKKKNQKTFAITKCTFEITKCLLK